MNTMTESTKATVVKILIAIPVLVFFFGLSSTAVAESKNDSSNTSRGACKEDALRECTKKDVEDKAECKRLAEQAPPCDGSGASCPLKRKEALEAAKEIKKACADAGMSGETCYSQAKRCSEISRESATDSNTSFNIFDSVSKIYGVDTSAANANKKKNQNGCPQYSGEDYRKRVKEINDELKQVKNDIADLKKEGTTLEKDTQKDMQDTQKDIQEAQKDLQEKQHDIDDDTRKQMNDLSKEQSDLKKSLSSTDQNIVSLRGKMAQSEADKADQMIALNDAMIKDTCVATYEKALYENQQSKLNRSLSFAEMKGLKQRMLNLYNTCILKYQQQRISILTKKDSEQAELKSQIVAAQDDMQETQRGIDSAQTQSSQIQSAATSKKNEAQQNMAQKIQTAQTSLQTAQTNMQKQQQNLQSRYDELNKRQNELNAELNAMGTEPDPDATMSPRKASGIIRSQMEAITAYSDDPKCCTGKDGKDSLCKEAARFNDADPNESDPQFKNGAQ